MNHLERALDGQNQIWKYIVIILIGFVATNLIGSLPLLIVMAIKTSQGYTPNPENLLDLTAYGIDLNTGLVLLLLPFVMGLLIIIPLIKNLHKRSFSEVVNGTKKIRWNRFFFSAGIWTLLMLVALLIGYLMSPQDYVLSFNPVNLIPLIVVALIIIPFQTTFEEFMFRGYLMQGVAACTKNRWLALIIPALLFGFLHILNPEIKEYGFWMVMPQYILFGLIFGIMVLMDDGLETAMGAHAANNIFLCIFVTSKGSALQTYALLEKINITPSLMDTLELLITGGILIIILGIKYKWKFSVLTKKVEIENI